MSVLASVIIPSFQRHDALAVCLGALLSSALPRDQYEIIVVDDGNANPLAPVAARFGARCVVQENSGPGQARNLGAANASSDLLVFLDDDCVPTPEWLPTLVKAHRQSPQDLLYGHVANGLKDNLYSEASQQIIDCIYAYLENHPRGVDDSAFSPFATTNNMALPRKQFEQTGGFHHSFRLAAAEDREFCARWLRLGWRLRHVPEAVVHHYHHLDLASYWRQHANYGYGSQQVRQLRALSLTPGRKIEPPAFYLSLLGQPFREGWTLRAAAISALIALSQAAMVAGVARKAREAGPSPDVARN